VENLNFRKKASRKKIITLWVCTCAFFLLSLFAFPFAFYVERISHAWGTTVVLLFGFFCFLISYTTFILLIAYSRTFSFENGTFYYKTFFQKTKLWNAEDVCKVELHSHPMRGNTYQKAVFFINGKKRKISVVDTTAQFAFYRDDEYFLRVLDFYHIPVTFINMTQ
jgi:hypothetical protein